MERKIKNDVQFKNISVDESIGFSYDHWHQLQCRAVSEQTAKDAADYLISMMKAAQSAENELSKKKLNYNRRHMRAYGYRAFNSSRPAGYGYLSMIYYTTNENPCPCYFYYDAPLRDTVVRYLFAKRLIYAIGRKMHQNTKHYAYRAK